MRRCHCGASWGHYRNDDIEVEIGGEAIPLCIADDELRKAIAHRPESRDERAFFTAYVIPTFCETVREQ